MSATKGMPFSSQVDQGGSFTQSGFKITTHKLPILKAQPIEEMIEKLRINPPEMIFGDNAVIIEHLKSGWSINFNAFDALDRVDKTGNSMLKVAYSKEWQQNRQHVHDEIKEVVKPFDWSYSTDYKGTISTGDSLPSFTTSTKPIPLALLTRPDPIKFFDEVMLYEDELADNGIAMLSIKIRVMPDRLLLLCRFFLRLDDVVFRIRDTRVFVEFQTGEVIREYTAREEKDKVLTRKIAHVQDDTLAMKRDPNRLAEFMTIVEHRLESVTLT